MVEGKLKKAIIEDMKNKKELYNSENNLEEKEVKKILNKKWEMIVISLISTIKSLKKPVFLSFIIAFTINFGLGEFIPKSIIDSIDFRFFGYGIPILMVYLIQMKIKYKNDLEGVLKEISNIMEIVFYVGFVILLLAQKTIELITMAEGLLLLFLIIEYLFSKEKEKEEILEKLKNKMEENIELYPSRRHQAEMLEKYLTEEDDLHSFILVDGEWGIGKTTFVKLGLKYVQEKNRKRLDKVKNELEKKSNENNTKLMEELKKEKEELERKIKINYDKRIININAMLFSTKREIIKVVFDELESYLEKNKICVNGFKEVGQYLESIMSEAKGVFRFLKGRDGGYEEKKAIIKRKLGVLGKDNQPILVVDNIERIEDKKHIIEILGFLHEVEEVDHIQVVVLADRSKLIGEKIELDINYMDKFFLKNLILTKINIIEIIENSNSSYKKELKVILNKVFNEIEEEVRITNIKTNPIVLEKEFIIKNKTTIRIRIFNNLNFHLLPREIIKLEKIIDLEVETFKKLYKIIEDYKLEIVKYSLVRLFDVKFNEIVMCNKIESIINNGRVKEDNEVEAYIASKIINYNELKEGFIKSYYMSLGLEVNNRISIKNDFEKICLDINSFNLYRTLEVINDYYNYFSNSNKKLEEVYNKYVNVKEELIKKIGDLDLKRILDKDIIYFGEKIDIQDGNKKLFIKMIIETLRIDEQDKDLIKLGIFKVIKPIIKLEIFKKLDYSYLTTIEKEKGLSHFLSRIRKIIKDNEEEVELTHYFKDNKVVSEFISYLGNLMNQGKFEKNIIFVGNLNELISKYKVMEQDEEIKGKFEKEEKKLEIIYELNKEITEVLKKNLKIYKLENEIGLKEFSKVLKEVTTHIEFEKKEVLTIIKKVWAFDIGNYNLKDIYKVINESGENKINDEDLDFLFS